MPLYKIDYRNGRILTERFRNLPHAKRAAAEGMLYTGAPVWIYNESGALTAISDWIDGEPGEGAEYLKIIEWEKGVGYYTKWEGTMLS